jgi:hypothetical protein
LTVYVLLMYRDVASPISMYLICGYNKIDWLIGWSMSDRLLCGGDKSKRETGMDWTRNTSFV